MISFESPNAFYVLALLFIVLFVNGISKSYQHYFSKEMFEKIVVGKDRKKIKLILLISSFIFLVISLARPVIPNKPIEVDQSNVSFVVAFDISKSMKSEDVYPNRLQFSKSKFNDILENLTDEKVGVIGFSNESFMVAPITNDYSTLKFLVENVNQDMISTSGSSVFSALQTANELLKDQKEKALIVFTDGTDSKEFSDAIDYANENNLKVFIYTVATKKGGVIPLKKGGVQKDSNGNIVITSLNENIKQLALQTDGAYLRHSVSSSDIVKFIDVIKNKFTNENKEKITISTNEELFYYPLVLALILFMLAISGFKRGVR